MNSISYPAPFTFRVMITQQPSYEKGSRGCDCAREDAAAARQQGLGIYGRSRATRAEVFDVNATW